MLSHHKSIFGQWLLFVIVKSYILIPTIYFIFYFFLLKGNLKTLPDTGTGCASYTNKKPVV